MKLFFSKQGFFNSEIHGNNIPDDAVEITVEEYENLINNQSKNYSIGSQEDGKPILISNEPALLTYKQLREMEYPSFYDYLDGIVKGDKIQVQAYIDACKKVKEKYPKTS